ncbi:MAG: leucine-rich repeat domain-containing protein [Saprospiraceae bacterium]|nr:leucine-rich repeat domain-containing protein [Saprospiraceae bacterium]
MKTESNLKQNRIYMGSPDEPMSTTISLKLNGNRAQLNDAAQTSLLEDLAMYLQIDQDLITVTAIDANSGEITVDMPQQSRQNLEKLAKAGTLPNYDSRNIRIHRSLQISFYVVDIDSEIRELVLDRNQVVEEKFQLWQGVVDAIGIQINQDDLLVKKIPTMLYGAEPEVVILLSETEPLCTPFLYNHLADSLIRKVFTNAMSASSYQAKGVPNADCYRPVIMIGLEDIMEFRERLASEEDPYLKSLRLDSRFKFFDSSIWHRYVPLFPESGNFQDHFQGIVREIFENLERGIYNTISARSHLEFQLRLMQNSYIAEFGRGGHDKSVTPFKFHSETVMRRRVLELESFFEKEVAGVKLRELLRWKILMIDDYAQKQLSTVPNETCQLSKYELIKERFLKDFTVKVDTVLDHDRERLDERETAKQMIDPGRCVAMVNRATVRLQEEPYDLILLDYLLGHKDWEGEEREYGYHLMQKLIQEGHTFKKGPFQRFWIFPFSSFPFALVDKLRQLGVGNLDHLWHLGSGGDPISMPHQFHYFLLSFIQQQLFEIYLSPKKLEQVLLSNSHIEDSTAWAEVMLQNFTNQRAQLTLLRHYDDLDENGFLFSVRELVNKGYSDFLEKVIDLLDEMATGITDYPSYQRLQERERAVYKIVVELFGHAPELPRIIKIIKSKIEALETLQAISAAKNRKLQNGTLNLAGLHLIFLPPEVLMMAGIKVLRLQRNELEFLPKEIIGCKQLRRLDIGQNRLRRLPKGLEELRELSILNTKGNPGLPNRSVTSRSDALTLLKDAYNRRDDLLRIESLIANREIREALNSLRDYAKEQGAFKIMNIVNTLQLRWAKIEEDRQRGIVSEDYDAIAENRVVSGLLSLMERIQSLQEDEIG